MAKIDRLWGVGADTLDGAELDALVVDVLVYEDIHYPIEPPTMEAAIEFHMERLGVVTYSYE